MEYKKVCIIQNSLNKTYKLESRMDYIYIIYPVLCIFLLYKFTQYYIVIRISTGPLITNYPIFQMKIRNSDQFFIPWKQARFWLNRVNETTIKFCSITVERVRKPLELSANIVNQVKLKGNETVRTLRTIFSVFPSAVSARPVPYSILPETFVKTMV